MVRILLVVTLIALGGAGYIAFNNVQGTINSLNGELVDTQDNLDRAQRDLAKSQKAEEEAEQKMAVAQGQAETAQSALRQVQARLVTQTQRADQHKKDLDKTTAELVDTRNKYQSWKGFEQQYGSQSQIKCKLAAYDEVSGQRDQYVIENGILLEQVQKLGVELARYTGSSVKVTLPRTLHGKVTAVDAQFDFVVLDIGESQGVREHGELLVSRGEKLIGKIRVLDVKKDHSIANILPNWKQGEIQTGDFVIVGN